MPSHRDPSEGKGDSGGPDRRARILEAARSMLMDRGLEGWSVERVAREAGCAKGLVHYHFRTRAILLAAVAAALRDARMDQRLAALAAQGTAALDALWSTMLAHADDGTAAAWLQLGVHSTDPVRAAMEPTAAALEALAARAGATLEMPPLPLATTRALVLILDGLEASLVRGAPGAEVRNAYDRIWLSLLG